MKYLVVYLTAGFPNDRIFMDIASKLKDRGVNYLEIGIPPKYAKYDGPVIRKSYRYVKSLSIDVWRILKETVKIVDIPIILLTYLEEYVDNYRQFLENVYSIGIDSILFPDLLIDLVDRYIEYIDIAKSIGIKIVLFVTPSMPDKFIENISPLSSHFLYYGIRPTTGIPIPITSSTLVKRIRGFVRNKLVVGFGLSIDEIADVVRAGADGIAIGSAIIEKLESNDFDGALKLIEDIRGVLNGVE
ncbi:tryptophan synthase, alpha chain [Ignisphaera aggregans DSM 17230]|uniref:tryptophan synthase n=1 Tax=Ignisphaera aggregans (strain DSM 17230 / JCM 13409 / AQ1.S1) TaxID=583356 RepID=E0SS57_IGNAA|nr:tryptophan synthase, alpha chain [Ignisphaera aggregans DSM 17230]